MPGIQFVIDDSGRKTAVVIDLRKHSRVWEDFYDRMIAEKRSKEPRESISAVKKRLRTVGKLNGWDHVVFARSARRELESLDQKAIARILPRIEALARQPRPRGAVKLQGSRDLWRIRVGDFRILYRVDDRGRLIDIIAIGDRNEIYRPR